MNSRSGGSGRCITFWIAPLVPELSTMSTKPPSRGVMQFVAWPISRSSIGRQSLDTLPGREELQRPGDYRPDVLLDSNLRDFRKVFEPEGIRALAFITLELDSGVLGKFSRQADCDVGRSGSSFRDAGDPQPRQAG